MAKVMCSSIKDSDSVILFFRSRFTRIAGRGAVLSGIPTSTDPHSVICID
ncbi:hypothetical protein GCM10007063_19390 [Lentibacillus kapialis]|uniref:Uncharacterized protein n=1 Tax=Lentibacillus kapialis TaxID=340214 RepID=A0A917UYL1_9BACI|nr:hypothetical protein GCM10007063_19390 [Lentibacillus kapialis]